MEEIQIKTYLFSALKNLRNNPEFTIRNGYDVEWLDKSQTKPTEEEINQEIIRLQEEFNNTEYQRLRKAEYPSMPDQLDALYHYFSDNNIENNFTNMLNEIKNKYPKPE